MRIKSYFRFTCAVLLVFGICFASGMGLANLIKKATMDQEDEGQPQIDPGKRTTILVMGVDARAGEANSRTDTMILVTIDPQLKKVAVVSIPRDTKISLNGYTEKINAAHVMGGAQGAVQAVRTLMGVPVDYYIEADFTGFEKMVDTLGGVTINVPQRMYKPSEGINLQPGVQRLSGKQALGFVRYRDYQFGDIDRTAKQQVFLAALAQEALQPGTIPKLPALVKEIKQYMKTDMNLSTMLKLASWAPGFTAASVVGQTLPGYFDNEFDKAGQLTQSYWVADKASLNGLVDNILAGKTIAVIQTAPTEVTQVANGTSNTQKTQTGSSPGGTSQVQSKSTGTATKPSSTTKTPSGSSSNGSKKSTTKTSSSSTTEG